MILPEDYLVTRALMELDDRLPEDFPVLKLNIVGGYALQIRQIRTNPHQATDLDYLGSPHGQEYRPLVDEVGAKYGLSPGWLNNDLQLGEYDSIADIEISTGPLEFESLQSDLTHFEVSVATVPTLLRMKLISLGDQLIGFLDDEFPSEFVRVNDAVDLRMIFQAMGLTVDQIHQVIDELAANDYVLLPADLKIAVKQLLTDSTKIQLDTPGGRVRTIVLPSAASQSHR